MLRLSDVLVVLLAGGHQLLTVSARAAWLLAWGAAQGV